LVAARQWRTLAAALATASCIVVASTLAFGASMWPAWLHHLPSILAVRSAHRLDWAPLLATVTSNLAMAGVGRRAANLVQLFAGVGSICCVWRCFRVWRPHWRDGSALLEVAALGAATFLATPFAFNYDLPLFTAAVLLFVDERRRANGTFLLREMLAIVAALLLPCFILADRLNGCSSLVVLVVLCTILHRIRALRMGHDRSGMLADASPSIVFKV
ncbi:MAG: glycosyltransferase 87 family protein, partial [Janthinobacterium lividum]